MLSKITMKNLKELADLAAAGDAAAQYRLAAHYDRAGRKEEAAALTASAAAAGHPGALYTQAAEMLSARPADMRVDEAISMLTRASKRGGHAASRQMAVLTALGLGVKRDWAKAVELLSKTAKAGYPPAMRELAALAAMASPEQNAGVLLREAALKGDWIALYLALRRGDVLSESESRGLAAKLKAAGAPLSERLQDPPGEAPAGADQDIQSLAQKATAYRPNALLKNPETLNKTPDIIHFRNVLSTEECDYLICAAAGLLTRSKVVDSDKSAASHAQYRTSDEAQFGLLDLDLALIAIYERLAHAAGVAVQNCELMGVLRYRPGEEYKPHHDYLPEDAGDYSEVKRSGQRVRTLLVPLNDNYKGGATAFPQLGLSFAGKPGDACVFHNTDAAENPFPETLHAGEPVTRGEKWLLTLWCRARPFWFWL